MTDDQTPPTPTPWRVEKIALGECVIAANGDELALVYTNDVIGSGNPSASAERAQTTSRSEALNTNSTSVDQPRPQETELENYRNAPSGIGPLADTWADKPHRLVYDLVALSASQAQEIERLAKENAAFCSVFTDSARQPQCDHGWSFAELSDEGNQSKRVDCVKCRAERAESQLAQATQEMEKLREPLSLPALEAIWRLIDQADEQVLPPMLHEEIEFWVTGLLGEEGVKQLSQQSVSSHASSSGQAWQPIETAPSVPNGSMQSEAFIGGEYHKTYGWIWGKCRRYSDKHEGEYIAGDVNPTHWMPLPPAPAQQEEK